ncbi:MAG: methionine ABC transporter ATP-binding protein [Mesorhizobium amorphae]|nr:MAG: methionine ABC transporter ATP-binding protein [Mesorhizobium amorphae]
MNQHVPRSALEKPPSPAQAEPVAQLIDVRRRFGETPALDGVSLTLRKGEVLGLIGRSGAGKSTLIRCLNGLERPDSGRVLVEGREISALGERALQPLRRRIGMVFQHFNLMSAKTVAENVALPLKIAGHPSAAREERVAELLDLVGLADKARHFPAQLSGGQKQRVGIARALAARPALLLSDEATSALDPETTQSILALLRDINRRLGLSVLLITHEMEVVRAVADRVAVIESGRIVEEGPVWQVFAEPQAPVTRRLLQSIRPELPPVLRERLVSEGDALLRVDVAGDAARGTLFAGLGAFRLLHGGIDHVGGEPVGTLFLAVPAEAAARARTHLEERGARVEGIGHVARDA